VLEIVEYNI